MSNDGTRRVIAQGTFDIVHTGHVHYFEEAAKQGDELVVIISRRQNPVHQKEPILPARQRRDLIAALDVVDVAILGHESDIFVPIERLDPDVIVLGHDQHHDVDQLKSALAERDIECDIARASPKPKEEGEVLSTADIIDRIVEREC